MATLSKELARSVLAAPENVPAWEFGEDENGEPYVIRVRPLTVGERNHLSRAAFDIRFVPGGEGNPGPTPVTTVRADYDEKAMVVGMCCIDDDGKLLFGETVAAAVEQVKNLPDKYMPLVRRLHEKILDISGWTAEAVQQAAEQAEKN